MNLAKRRRLNEPSYALSKPFRSPLKSISTSRGSNIEQSREDSDVQEASNRRLKDHDDTEVPTSNPSPATTLVEPPPKLTSSSQSTKAHHDSPSSLVDTVKALKKEHIILTQQLQQRRQDLNALQQSLTIHSTNDEEKLNLLITKWRNIARDAADDLFESASSRVKEMGGLQAWHDNALGTYIEDINDCEGDALLSGERDTNDEEGREQLLIAAGTKAVGVTLDQGHQLTMDMMLRQLNIAPDLLDFDPEKEQWRD